MRKRNLLDTVTLEHFLFRRRVFVFFFFYSPRLVRKCKCTRSTNTRVSYYSYRCTTVRWLRTRGRVEHWAGFNGRARCLECGCSESVLGAVQHCTAAAAAVAAALSFVSTACLGVRSRSSAESAVASRSTDDRTRRRRVNFLFAECSMLPRPRIRIKKKNSHRFVRLFATNKRGLFG